MRAVRLRIRRWVAPAVPGAAAGRGRVSRLEPGDGQLRDRPDRPGLPVGTDARRPISARIVRSHGIKTVLNLRGAHPEQAWYRAERSATLGAGATQIDMAMSSCEWMSRDQARMLVRVLDTCEYPLLIHCWRGSERTGLVSAMTELLRQRGHARRRPRAVLAPLPVRPGRRRGRDARPSRPLRGVAPREQRLGAHPGAVPPVGGRGLSARAGPAASNGPTTRIPLVVITPPAPPPPPPPPADRLAGGRVARKQ